MLIAVNTRFLIKDKLEGIGWFTYETMKRITQNHPEHKFLFLFDRDWDDSFIFSDNIIPIKVWPPARHPYLWKYWFDFALPKIFKKYKPDLFISTDGFLSLQTKIPTILVIHDLGFESFPEHTPSIVNKYYQRFTPIYAHTAKKIVTVSQYSKQDIINRYKIPSDKIDVVFNGANELFVPINNAEKKQVREKYSKNKNYFLYVGSIHPRKNIDKLLIAFDAFKKESNSELQLVIAGRMAWKTEETKYIYENMQYKDSVVFTGHLQLHDLIKVTAAADAFVFPSLFEGFGIPVIEARYCDVPIICSNNSSIPEVGGIDAIYFDASYEEDIKLALMRFIERKNTYVYKESNAEVRNKFNWDSAAQKLFATVLEVAKEKQIQHTRNIY